MTSSAIRREDVQDILPLTALQEGMLYHALAEPTSAAYFQQLSFRLRGDLDLRLFEQAWNHLIARHDVLRAAFVVKNTRRPLQCILKSRPLTVHYADISAWPESEQQPFLDSYKRGERMRGFDLTSDLLMRVSLFRVGPDEHIGVWGFHHIIMDGWCANIVQRELWNVYAALRAARPPALAPVPSYAQFLTWLQKQDGAAAKSFWQRYMEHHEDVASPPKRHDGSTSGEYRLDRRVHRLDQQMSSGLRGVAKRYGSTLNEVLQTLWALLLSRYVGRDDVVFGVTVSGRPEDLPGVESMIGLFINTVPLRVRVPRQARFSDVLRDLRESAPAWRQHGHYSLAEIRNLTANNQAPFDHNVVFEPRRGDDNVSFPVAGLAIEQLDGFEQSSFDLELSISTSDTIALTFCYDQRAYRPEQIDRVAAHVRNAVLAVIRDSEQFIRDIDFLEPTEKGPLVAHHERDSLTWLDSTVTDLFSEQVNRSPDSSALQLGERRLTFAQLSRRAHYTAHLLHETVALHVGDRIGICSQRSEFLLIGILGILEAGAAYVPVEPTFPLDRIRYIFTTAGCRAILAEPALHEQLRQICDIPLVDIRALTGERDSAPPVPLRPAHPAYVMFTSGSTGRPKGVQVPHRSVSAFTANMSSRFGLRSGDRMLALTSSTFDISVLELLHTLLVGATVVLADDEETGDPARIAQIIATRAVSATQVTPSRLKILLEHGAHAALSGLRVLLIGGEPLSTDLFAKLRTWPAEVRRFNVYGPTETTIWSTCKEILHDEQLTIGTPLAHEHIWILDQIGDPVPEGSIGEICISGTGLADGYLGRPAHTAEQFRPHPHEPGGRIYRTGDRGRRLPGGELECLGRFDEQVKIRGYRVEPGEIAAALKAHVAVKDAVVTVSRDGAGDGQLMAHIQLAEPVSDEALRDFLGKTLPGYMIPSLFHRLDQFPLLTSGKIDRKALQALGPARSERSPASSPPRNQLERDIAETWAGVLEHADIGIHDTFVELGGHSLKAMRVAMLMQKQFHIELSPGELFRANTVAKLATEIRRRATVQTLSIPRQADADDHSVSPAQQRLWILDRLDEGASAAYNMPSVFRIEGALDVHALTRAFEEVEARHEALRTVFVERAGALRQCVRAPGFVRLQYIDLHAHESPEGAAMANVRGDVSAPFDLSTGPLARVKLLGIGTGRWIGAFIAHHSICDGQSIDIIFREWFAAYRRLTGSEQPGLPQVEPRPVQYRDYTAWYNDLLDSDTMRNSRAYWCHQLAGLSNIAEFPSDLPRPSQLSQRGQLVSLTWSSAQTSAFIAFTRANHSTVFSGLVTAIKVLLMRMSGSSDTCVGTPVSGRTHPDLNASVGCFVNTLVLRHRLDHRQPFAAVLSEVTRTVMEALQHQDYPFDRLVHDVGVERIPNRAPLFDVMIAYREQSENAFLPAVTYNSISLARDTARFDLTFECTLRDGKLETTLNYSCDLFHEDTAQRILERLMILADDAIRRPGRPVGHLDLLSQHELARVAISPAPDSSPLQGSIATAFAAQVLARPDHPALTNEQETLTYRELDQLASELAVRLSSALPLAPEPIVGVMAKRGEWPVVALLACAKVGAIYLPLDPALPDQRIRFMVEDSRCALLLAEPADMHRISGLPIIPLRREGSRGDVALDHGKVSAQQAAYVIYTSGSTGRPKGVAVSHEAILNTARDQIERFGIQPRDRVLLFAPSSFDASLSEMLMALVSGATLIATNEELIRDPNALLDFIDEHAITVITFPPPYLAALSRHRLGTVRVIISAGSAAIPQDASFYSAHKRFFNAYGPTETAVCATAYQVDAVREFDNVPIGTALKRTSVYVLDEHLELMPVGAPGELYVRGVGLARGYLWRPGLTAERFVPSPFGSGERLYKTGDRGRRLANGDIELLGRIDDQVKLRGFRIELGEVEQTLSRHPDIVQAAVIAHRRSDQPATLSAFYVSRANVSSSQVEAFLRTELPDYMIPVQYIALETIPLTHHGKIDRRALALVLEQHLARQSSGATGAAPTSPVQRRVMELFAQLLPREPDGIDADFFGQGGDSLALVHLASHIAKEWNIRIAVRSLLLRPTVAGIAGLVQEHLDHKTAREERVPEGRRQAAHDVLVRAPRRDARLRLFCFPFAGGGAAIYRTWGQHVEPALDVCAVQLPGREGRFREPPFRSMEPLLDYLELSLKPYLDRPFAFFGHSMGGLIGFELARRLTQRRLPRPCHVFISGRRAPHIAEGTVLHQLPDSALVAGLRRWQGTPDAVLANAEVLELVLPCLRADMEVVETYRHEEREPLACPISVFGGMDDKHASQEQLAAWGRHTRGPFTMRLLPGGHFFIQQERDAILATVRQELGHLLGE